MTAVFKVFYQTLIDDMDLLSNSIIFLPKEIKILKKLHAGKYPIKALHVVVIAIHNLAPCGKKKEKKWLMVLLKQIRADMVPLPALLAVRNWPETSGFLNENDIAAKMPADNDTRSHE